MNGDGTGFKAVVTLSPEIGAFFPVFAPNGRSIRFYAQRCFTKPSYHCHGNLMLMDPNGKHLRAIPNSAFAMDASFSPRGTFIVFDRNGNVFRMRANGTQTHQLTNIVSLIGTQRPSYSPDGKQIVFLNTAGDHITVMNSSGSDQHAVNVGSLGAANPAWQASR